MKILLVGIGRCGTISLSNAFYNQNYHVIAEPFSMDTTGTNINKKKFQFGWWNRNKEEELNFFLNKEKNTLVKTLVGQSPKQYHGFKTWQSFICEFVKNFDKVLWIDRKNLDFTVEMETGTGKTYVYLRTIVELYKKYGFSKHIIVVPSIPIKEGVYKSLQITKEHLRELDDLKQRMASEYELPPYDFIG